jgi:outer membrane lipoprotein carrier protein
MAGGVSATEMTLGDQRADADQANTSTNKLRALLLKLDSLDARFEQTVYSIEGDVLQQTSGHLIASRPGKVRWETNPPLEQLVISDSETLWIYDPDLEQVSIRPFNQNLSNTPAALFIGDLGTLESSYDISHKQGDITDEYTLVPLVAHSLYEKVALGFTNKIPSSMTLWDSLGQKTKIIFHGQRLNQALDLQLFHFDPPEGVDILRDE